MALSMQDQMLLQLTFPHLLPDVHLMTPLCSERQLLGSHIGRRVQAFLPAANKIMIWSMVGPDIH